MTPEEVVEAWRTNNRINLLLLEAVSDEGLSCTLSTRGGRDVGRQFAHMHDIRCYHLEKRAKRLSEGLSKFASKETPARGALEEALIASGDAVALFLEELADGVEGVRGFRKGVPTTLAYFVSHESHHRGSIVLTLKQCGHPVEKKVRYGIWDWDRR